MRSSSTSNSAGLGFAASVNRSRNDCSRDLRCAAARALNRSRTRSSTFRITTCPITTTAASGEHLGSELGNLDDYVGRDIGPPRGDPDRLGIRRLIEAVGFPLVGAEEREQPSHPFLIVDLPNLVGALLGHFQGFGKIPFDHKAWHESLLSVRK